MNHSKSVMIEPKNKDAFYIITRKEAEFHTESGRLLDWTGSR